MCGIGQHSPGGREKSSNTFILPTAHPEDENPNCAAGCKGNDFSLGERSVVLRAAVLCSVSCSPSEKRSGECLHAGDEEESVDEGQMCGSAPRCVWDNACRMHGSTHPYQVLGIRGMKHCLGTASKPNCLKVMVGQPCSAWRVSLPCAIGLCWESINTSLLWEGEEHIPLEATSSQGGILSSSLEIQSCA